MSGGMKGPIGCGACVRKTFMGTNHLPNRYRAAVEWKALRCDDECSQGTT